LGPNRSKTLKEFRAQTWGRKAGGELDLSDGPAIGSILSATQQAIAKNLLRVQQQIRQRHAFTH
jgi:hypothetical protein